MVFDFGTAVVASLAGMAVGALGIAFGARSRRAPPLRQPLSQAESKPPTPAPATETARTDALTGLPDRASFDLALDRMVAAVDKHDGEVCVLCVGIDNFQLLNDTYGHDNGDTVLRESGVRLGAIAGPRAATARLGGTEFVVAIPGSIEFARRLASSLLRRLSQAIDIDTNHLQVGCSIGIAIYPHHGARPWLVNHASMAMRAARQSGGGAHAEFDIQMADDQREQAELARDLRMAIERNQLMLYYQPKVDAQSMKVTAAEALLRWQHPTRGIVSPTVFIPIAERHGLIGPIGNWVLDETTRQAAVWRERGLRMRVAINVSGYQMRQDDFIDRLAGALESNRLVPSRFTCEITETVAMEDTLVTQRAFARLGELGVHVSIDDFGTGHSSLAVLRRLPAAEVKIDRAFVTDLGRSADALAVARAIVQLAHSLDLRVVAEGVETEAQRDHLLALGCDELQGFLFARPMPAAALELWAMDENSTDHPEFSASLFRETQQVDL
jgi:diguanylate cyclase (GGDEF)-like protein